VNRAEKEAYLRDYEIAKKKGKPFFPYAVMKDTMMMLIVALVIVTLSILLGAEQGPKVDPTTTTYTPRPEWYFFFLFELLRVIKPPWAVPIATIGIPTLCMVLLLALPFYDRNPERRIERRPIALTAGILTIVAMAYLTFLGATAGPPSQIDLKTTAALEDRNRRADPAQRDRALAAGGSGHHARLHRPAPAEVPGPDRVPGLAQLTSINPHVLSDVTGRADARPRINGRAGFGRGRLGNPDRLISI
jgi:hypothetical protein